MLKINETHYSPEDFERHYQQFANMNMLENGTVSRIAICLEDNATWLALCFFLKRQQVSVMPIHPSTPLQTAIRLAERADCNRLYYHNLSLPVSIRSETKAQETAGLIQMSSGTTGEPKCINRSWRSIDTEIASYVKSFTKPENMTPIVACPVTHSYGLICGVMVALARGQTPHIVTDINPKYLIKTLQNCQRPLLYSSPTMLQGLIRLWPKNSKIHAAMTSGTIMSRPVFEQLSPYITHLFQQYGCSEAGCVAINQNMTCTQDVGTPLPHLKVSSSNRAEQPEEIIVTVESDVAGQPAQVIHTQDLGYLHNNEEGETMLRFVARLDDTIIVAGLNVYPQDVEDIILRHPDIVDAVVFKVDDHFAGQRVCLQFTAQKTLDERTLRHWCTEQLASYQVPHRILQVTGIERLPNGKVNRKKIANDLVAADQARHAETSAAQPTSLAL